MQTVQIDLAVAANDFELLLVPVFFLLIEGATVIVANEVTLAFPHSSHTPEALPFGCIHDKVPSILVFSAEVVTFRDIYDIKFCAIYIIGDMIHYIR